MNLNGLLNNKIVVSVAAFLVSFGAAIAISGAITGGDTKATLPETAKSVPVIAPVATGPIPTADDPAAPTGDGTAGGGSGGGGSGGGGSGGSGGGGSGLELSPVVAQSTDFAGDVSELGGTGAPSDGEPLPTFPGLTRFVDDCAGTEPGATPPEGCPDPATGGTVLELASHHPSPQRVWFLRVPDLLNSTTNRCSVRVDGNRDEPWAVVALNPGTMKLAYWPQPEGPAGIPVPDADVVTIDGSTVAASTPEHSLWSGWFENDTVGDGPGHYVEYCEVLHDLVPGRFYAYRVTSTDIFGSTAEVEGIFVAHDERRRPPVSVTSTSPTGTAFAVTVPVRSGEGERSLVTAVPASGEDASTCEQDEASRITERIPPGTTREIPASLREADGYPYKPAYDQTTTTELRLAEGRTYNLCIWWQSGPEHSFDPAAITERETRHVTTANRYRVSVTLHQIDFTRSVDEQGVEFRVRSAGAPSCGARLPRRDVRVTETVGRHVSVTEEYNEIICDLTSDVNSLDVGDALDVEITGPFGQSLTSRVDISARPGADISSYYRLNIPAERAVVRACETDLPSGCRGRRPPRDESVGAAVLRVDLTDGPNAGGTAPSFGPDAPFYAADGPAPPERPYAQIDSFTSSVRQIPGRTDGLRVIANLDRPASVRAYVISDSESPEGSCLLPGASGSATSAAAETHDFVLDGLCPGTLYFVALELTDAEGHLSHVAWREGSTPEPQMNWDGHARTAYVVVTINARLTVLETPDVRNVVAGQAQIGGANIFEYAVSRCVSGGEYLAIFNHARRQFSANEVLVTVDLDATTACGGGSTVATTSIRRLVPLADLLAGATVTLTSPEEDSFRVQLELSSIYAF